ncbi:hypothetical protein [Salinispora sp. H7-4]|uniref:hypothetical protein n=1 Tax=Salinispora sp. H7-4 TaxID=2748321 RepID=UPI0015D3FDE6|nr:hypothetical protein [Salinispora sp. H7-4]NYT96591.1 hypothetical protein [Salinispora sp. H7-4]
MAATPPPRRADRAMTTSRIREGAPLPLLWLRVHGLAGYLAAGAVVAACYLWQRLESADWPFPLNNDVTFLPAVLAVGALLGLGSGVEFLERRHPGLVGVRTFTVATYGILGVMILLLRPSSVAEDLPGPMPTIRSFMIALGIGLIVQVWTSTVIACGLVIVRALVAGQFTQNGNGASLFLWDLAPLDAVPYTVAAVVLLGVGTAFHATNGPHRSP